MNRIFNEIASKYNVTPDEVERDIAQALVFARKSTSTHAKAFWRGVDEDADVKYIIRHIVSRLALVV